MVHSQVLLEIIALAHRRRRGERDHAEAAECEDAEKNARHSVQDGLTLSCSLRGIVRESELQQEANMGRLS